MGGRSRFDGRQAKPVKIRQLVDLDKVCSSRNCDSRRKGGGTSKVPRRGLSDTTLGYLDGEMAVIGSGRKRLVVSHLRLAFT